MHKYELIAEQQGWTDQTLVGLMEAFIEGNPTVLNAFNNYAVQIAEQENEFSTLD